MTGDVAWVFYGVTCVDSSAQYRAVSAGQYARHNLDRRTGDGGGANEVVEILRKEASQTEGENAKSSGEGELLGFDRELGAKGPLAMGRKKLQPKSNPGFTETKTSRSEGSGSFVSSDA
jgi:hypothetical protein